MMMLPSSCSVLLIAVFACSDSSVISQVPGESITLGCDPVGCPQSIKGYSGLYLLHVYHQEEEVLFVHTSDSQEFSERPKYKGRIQTNGSSFTFTIINLTANDSGIYKCVYKKMSNWVVQCSVYAVVITETTRCASPTTPPTPDPNLPLTLYIISACIIGVLIIWIFFLLVIPRVKRQCSERRRARRVSNEYVYEDMSKNRSPALVLPH